MDQHGKGRAASPTSGEIRNRVPALRELLVELTSGDDVRAENSISRIVDLGGMAIPSLLELIRSDSVDARWWAVRALAASPIAGAEAFLSLLADRESEVRAAAALAVCSHPDEKAVPALIKTLEDDDSLVAGLAGKALVKIGSPSVAGLLEAMESTNGSARIIALRSLAEIRDPRAIPVMMKSISEGSAVLQFWAQDGLERLGLDMVYIKP